MIMVDTSVWIDYFNGNINAQSERLEKLLSEDIVIIGDIILAEILQGFRYDKDFIQARNSLNQLGCVNIGGKPLAIRSAENFRKLRESGITIRKTTDMLIATYCIQHHITLLHNDRDFDPMVKHLGLKSLI